MIFSLNSAGVRVFFAHFFEEEFCDGRGRGSRSLCGEHATASFWREPRPSGGHASAGGRSRVLGFCVRGVCVLGMALVCSLLICSSGRGACGPLAQRAAGGGPLAWRAAGRRSTGSVFRGPAVHPSKTPLWRGRQERLVYFHFIIIKNNNIK